MTTPTDRRQQTTDNRQQTTDNKATSNTISTVVFDTDEEVIVIANAVINTNAVVETIQNFFYFFDVIL